MPLHLVKLCVGINSIAELRRFIGERAKTATGVHAHVTRMRPSRAQDLLERRLALLGHQGPDLRATKIARTGGFFRLRRHTPLRAATGRRGFRRHPPPLPPLPGLALPEKRERSTRPFWRGRGHAGTPAPRPHRPRAALTNNFLPSDRADAPASPASRHARARPVHAGKQRNSPAMPGLVPGIHAGTQPDAPVMQRRHAARLARHSTACPRASTPARSATRAALGQHSGPSRRLLAAAPSQKLKPASKVETRKPQHLVHVLFHVKHLKKSNLANPLFPKDKPAAQTTGAPHRHPPPPHISYTTQKLHARKQAFSSRNSHEFHRFPPTFRRFRTKHPQPEVEFSSPGFSDATAHSCKRGGTGASRTPAPSPRTAIA